MRFCVEIFRLSEGVPKKLAETLDGLMFNAAFSEGLCADAMLARFFTRHDHSVGLKAW
jgi:hypothetical protein